MAVIYALECTVNGFAYIGCTTVKPAKRLREHRCLLRQRKHSSQRMVEDWHLYGEATFELKILERLPVNADIHMKREAELRWMDDYKARGKMYNIAHTSFAGTPASLEKAIKAAVNCANAWKRQTPEARMKRRLAQLGKPKGHGAKISATKRAKRAAMSGDEIVCSAENK